MIILIVCKLLDDFTIYDSCLRLHVYYVRYMNLIII